MSEQNKKWYVMRSIFHTEMKTKIKLEQAGIRTFIPMNCCITSVRGKKIKTLVPAVRNLMFVYSDEKTLAPFLAADTKFQFIYRRGYSKHMPLIIPEEQMEQFICAAESSTHPLYFTPSELNVAGETRIRIIGGALDGIVGTLVKVTGVRAKRLVVEIQDTLVVAVEVNPDLIEVLQPQD